MLSGPAKNSRSFGGYRDFDLHDQPFSLRSGLGTYYAPMPVDGIFCDSEAEPEPGCAGVFRIIGTFEWLEHLREHIRRDSRAAIDNPYLEHITPDFCTDIDP